MDNVRQRQLNLEIFTFSYNESVHNIQTLFEQIRLLLKKIDILLTFLKITLLSHRY